MKLEASSKIIVIEPTSAKRQLMVQCAKALNLGDVQGIPSYKDAISMLEVEQIDWLIGPLVGNPEDSQGVQLLGLILGHPQLRNLRVTLLAEPEHLEQLEFCCGKGLLCHFSASYNKDSFAKELEDFYKIYEISKGNDTRISSIYLRTLLRANQKHESIISLEKRLLEIYPGEGENLLSLGEAYFQMQNVDAAKGPFSQAIFIGADTTLFSSTIEALGLSKDPDPANLPPAFNWDQCCVLVQNNEKRNEISALLKQLGVADVLEYDEGEGAWLGLEQRTEPIPTLLMDWSLQGLSGPAFLQRVKAKSPETEIIVLGDKFEDGDDELLKEMGVTAVLKYSFERKDLISTMIYVYRQKVHPSDGAALEREFRIQVEKGDLRKAIEAKVALEQIASFPTHRKILIEAELSFLEGNYPRCKELAIESIKSQKDSVHILNLLGKCLLKLNEADSAVKCFLKAQEMSPKNITRLCAIALTASSQAMENKELSKDALEQAKSIDANSTAVQEAQSTIHIIDGETEQAKNLMKKLPGIGKIISFMNNQAIALAKVGSFETSFTTYEQTLASVPESDINTQSKVMFNLGFAYLRAGNLEQASVYFNKVIASKIEPLSGRALNIGNKIKAAQAKGLSLKFSAEMVASIAKSEDKKVDPQVLAIQRQEIMANLTFEPGGYACFRIFTPTLGDHQALIKLFNELPRFTPRELIKRDESGGLEKMIQRS